MFTLLQATANNAAPQTGGFDWSMIIMLVAMFAIIYFFMIRPQKNQQKKIENFRNSLKVGDKIVTAGGVHATIKSLNEGETFFTIEVAKGVTIDIERSYVFDASQPVQR